MADEDHVEVSLEEAPKVEKVDGEEIKVEVEDTPAGKSDTPKTEAKKQEVSADEGIDKLKRKFEVERQRAAEAERRAAEAEIYAQRASIVTKDANYQLVVGAIETVKGRSEALKAAYSSAMAAGDFDKAAEVQEALAVNAHQLSELSAGEREMRAQLEEAARQPIKPMPRNEEPLVEQIAKSVSAKSASWLRSHKDALNDERAVKRMFRAHEDAIDDGIEPDSNEYFEFIENRLGLRREEAAEEAPEPAPTPKRSAPPPPAPVSRGGQRPNVVRLSRQEAETAKMFGMTEAEYARNKVALQREGKMGS